MPRGQASNEGDLEAQILRYLRVRPGLTAREMASELGVDRTAVNRLLHGRLRGQVRQDRAYRWYLMSEQSAGRDDNGEQIRDTALGRLVHYYLDCIRRDAPSISVYASSRTGHLDYAEISALPGLSNGSPFAGDEVAALLGRVRYERQATAYFGFPVVFRWRRGRQGWEGGFVEPLFLFPLEVETSEQPIVPGVSGFPVINGAAMKSLVGGGPADVANELLALERDLGLYEVDAAPDFDELYRRLADVRPEWPWKEKADPERLEQTPRLCDVRNAGIYNRAVVLLADRPRYTAGLEAELYALGRLLEDGYAGTALGEWISGQGDEGRDAGDQEGEDKHVLEVVPLNDEQREAVRRALSQRLTVITGPPGTGKSQVVTSILVNAAYRRQKVLFASKNNKAVDVVEVRVNALGPRPILVRLGGNQHAGKLAEYLLSLLAATLSSSEEEEYAQCLRRHEKLLASLSENEKEKNKLIGQRNLVDELDEESEKARRILPQEGLAWIKHHGAEHIEGAAKEIGAAMDAADRGRQSLPVRIAWRLVRRSRYGKLSEVVRRYEDVLKKLGVGPPPVSECNDIGAWRTWSKELNERVALSARVGCYFEALSKLRTMKGLEELTREQIALEEEIRQNACQIWSLWLRIQAAKLSKDDRRLLSQYSTVLRMLAEAGGEGELPAELRQKYRDLRRKVSHLLPCLAITSLSARGRIPWEAGGFDLLVIDEASQCDIASALPLLYRARRVVVIGDQQQLRHISTLPKGQDAQLLVRYGLAQDFANWAYSQVSLFELAAGIAGGEDIVTLRDHFRSHGEIIEFSNRYFYEGKLRLATPYKSLRRPSWEKHSIRWVDVKGEVRRPVSGGAVNEKEAKAVIAELKELIVEKGYEGSVGVVTPFRAQANRIRELASADKSLWRCLPQAEFLCDTVHGFQGDERDVMIFSPVVSSGITEGALRFLENSGNLFNVAITRARAMLVVVGDREAAKQCPVRYLRDFSSYVTDVERQEAESIDQKMSDLGSEYPPVPDPSIVSEWEKILYRALHQAGIRCIPQYKVEQYSLDLALIDGDRRLDIEVDGERYHRAWDGELCRLDQIRNQRLYELGWDVMRFWVYEVRDDLEGCVRRVQEWKKAGGAS